MAKIIHPVTGFTGRVANVDFADGQAHTDNPGSIAYFARKGYTIEEPKTDKSDKTTKKQ